MFIDCRKQYAHSSSEKLWSLSWIHFYGPNMTAIYDKYLERGGRAVFHPVSVSGFLEICHRIYELADSDDYMPSFLHNSFHGLLALCKRYGDEVSAEGTYSQG